MISFIVTGLKEVNIGLDQLSSDVSRGENRKLIEVGRIVESEGKKRAPVAPTKSQSAGSRGPSKSRYHRGRAPGELANSINMVVGNLMVTIGVLSGPALAYAEIIHDKRGKNWKFLGPGSKAKGSLVGDLYMDRAWDDNERPLLKMLDDGVNPAVKRFNRS